MSIAALRLILAGGHADYLDAMQMFLYSGAVNAINDAIKESRGEDTESRSKVKADLEKMEREYDTLSQEKLNYEMRKTQIQSEINGISKKIKSMAFRDPNREKSLLAELEKNANDMRIEQEWLLEAVDWLKTVKKTKLDGGIIDKRDVPDVMQTIWMTKNLASMTPADVDKLIHEYEMKLRTPQRFLPRTEEEILRLKAKIEDIEKVNAEKESLYKRSEELEREILALDKKNTKRFTNLRHLKTNIDNMKLGLSYNTSDRTDNLIKVRNAIELAMQGQDPQNKNAVVGLILNALKSPTGGGITNKGSGMTEYDREILVEYMYNRLLNFSWRKFDFSKWADDPVKHFMWAISPAVKNVAKDAMSYYKQIGRSVHLEPYEDSTEDPLEQVSEVDLTEQRRPSSYTILDDDESKRIWEDVRNHLSSGSVMKSMIDMGLQQFRGFVKNSGQKSKMGLAPESSMAGWVPLSADKRLGGKYQDDEKTRALWQEVLINVIGYVDGRMVQTGSMSQWLVTNIKRFLKGEADKDKQARAIECIVGLHFIDHLIVVLKGEMKERLDEAQSYNKPMYEVEEVIEDEFNQTISLYERAKSVFKERLKGMSGISASEEPGFADPKEMVNSLKESLAENKVMADYQPEDMEHRVNRLLGLEKTQFDKGGDYSNMVLRDNLDDTKPVVQDYTDRLRVQGSRFARISLRVAQGAQVV